MPLGSLPYHFASLDDLLEHAFTRHAQRMSVLYERHFEQVSCALLSQPSASPDVVGMAFYQLAELHRLRGDVVAAEEAFRQASRFGRSPQPGLAQLRLAQGKVDAAMTAIRTALDEAPSRVARAKLLPRASTSGSPPATSHTPALPLTNWPRSPTNGRRR